MLISKTDNDASGPQKEDHSQEYQTASELFDLMARDHDFENLDEDLTTRDLVILYKNLDIGTKLISNANEFNKLRRPNQHVETIVYAEDPDSDGSEISDVITPEDIKTVFAINNERIDLLNNQPSYDNTLCHKLGDLQIQASQLSTEYDKHFLFQDPYIKQQLKSSKMLSGGNELDETVLPVSLLDYICCKRLEDNYTFYMDNIIRYVKHTIEQLKRISNGDYLTDRAKEMWKEVENQNDRYTKVLATSTSIPLHVERKKSGHVSSWDDIVHSEVDVRSLSKILEKKIVLEIPKLICGSYKLFSKRRAENLIISCKREKSKCNKDDSNSRMDVVLQLQRSESGQVMSNISSIMILQAAPTILQESKAPELLPLPYIKPEEEIISQEERVKIVEIDRNDSTCLIGCETKIYEDLNEGNESPHEGSILESIEYITTEKEVNNSKSYNSDESNELCDTLRKLLDRKEMLTNEALNIISPDDLHLTMQRLDMQPSFPEESCEDLSPRMNLTAPKKKSPTRVRIKSPYENKSHVLEEKKRKKLLEIRERRERKKLTLGENGKINKHYSRSATIPQTSTSVTKLSITNKSFYNSIYGQNVPLDSKSVKGKPKNIKKEIIPEIPLNDAEGEYEQSLETPDKNSKKYVNRSYYLDEAETEMMYLKTKLNSGDLKDSGSASTSAVSNDFRVNMTLLSQLIGPSESDLDGMSALNQKSSIGNEVLENEVDKKTSHPLFKDLVVTQSSTNVVPANTPKEMHIDDHRQPKKTSSAAECRESIDQIYDLMKQIRKTDLNRISKSRDEITNVKSDKVAVIATRGSSTIQGSDSGTSLKHYQTSSVPSCFSFDKANADYTKQQSSLIKKPETPAAVVSKVIINTKLQTSALDKGKKDKRVVINPTIKIRENPLKAISQLLHEFENVQKTRQKHMESKLPKKVEAPSGDVKNAPRHNYFLRRSKVDQNKDIDSDRFKKLSPRQRALHAPPKEVPKLPHLQSTVEEKRENIFRKKLSDIIDQAKEARGEAVRGPSKFPSRLNALAQPKRTYVQAHSEEYHSKYGRNLVTDRLQRLASGSVSAQRPLGSAASKNKTKKPEALSAVSVKQSPPVSALERVAAPRYSMMNSIDKVTASPAMVPPNKHNVPNAPETLERMVAVESYVNNHYGRAPAAGDHSQNAEKSRVPLLPSDIGLASEMSNSYKEQSTALGSKLHRIIASMVNANPPSLVVLSEDLETKFIRNNTEESLTDSLCKDIEHISTDSDYPIDILRDQNVETVVNDPQNMKTKEDNVVVASERNQYDIQPSNSFIELDKLEKALYRKMSVGAFQKRLRIKNLTLTPKQSMQQIFALQSGDVGAAVRATISQVKLNKGGSLCEIKSLSLLSKTSLDWRFSSFPMQVTTVGYAFPNYNKSNPPCRSKVVSVDNITNNKDIDRCHLTVDKSDEILQRSKIFAHITKKEQYVEQVNLTNSNNLYDAETKAVESKAIITSSDDFNVPLGLTGCKEINDETIYEKPNEHLDDVDYTTSLDMLVGLLSEIQKITSCQTQLANNDREKNTQSKELEIMLNNAAALETSTRASSHEPTSMPSQENMKQMESSTCIYTCYMSKNGDLSGETQNSISRTSIIEHFKPLTVDKEVSANLLDREYVSNFTDIPSQCFPLTFNHSTNVTSSLIGVLSQPSSQSMFSFTEYHTYTSSFEKDMIELPKLQKTDESQHSLVPYIEIRSKDNEKPYVDLYPVDISKKLNNPKSLLNQRIITVNKMQDKDDFDSILKMKRDILVTFYSILVFTVFAALSIPEIMYNV